MRWLDEYSPREDRSAAYAAYLIAAVQTLALGAPPTAVEQSMGRSVSLMWLGLLIVCPLLCGVGLLLRHRPGGLWIVVAGDLGAAFAAAAYGAAVFQTTWASRASFAAWVAVYLAYASLRIGVRDMRRVQSMTRRAERMAADREC